MILGLPGTVVQLNSLVLTGLRPHTNYAYLFYQMITTLQQVKTDHKKTKMKIRLDSAFLTYLTSGSEKSAFEHI